MDIILPIILIILIAVAYTFFLLYRRRRVDAQAHNSTKVPHKVIKSAPVVPYVEPILLNFRRALEQALPDRYLIYLNVPIEKLFDASSREELNMKGQYADFVIFSQNYMPILVIDLFDMSIINLNRVNKIKTASKEILRNSGIPVLDYQYTDNCNIDELRRKIADLLNPLRR